MKINVSNRQIQDIRITTILHIISLGFFFFLILKGLWLMNGKRGKQSWSLCSWHFPYVLFWFQLKLGNRIKWGWRKCIQYTMFLLAFKSGTFVHLRGLNILKVNDIIHNGSLIELSQDIFQVWTVWLLISCIINSNFLSEEVWIKQCSWKIFLSIYVDNK